MLELFLFFRGPLLHVNMAATSQCLLTGCSYLHVSFVQYQPAQHSGCLVPLGLDAGSVVVELDGEGCLRGGHGPCHSLPSLYPSGA